MSTQNIIAISYAKRALTPGTRERERMNEYGAIFESYHLIVFTKASEGFPALQQDGNLFLHATNAHTKVGMVLKALSIGLSIIRKNPTGKWVASGQDPLAAGLVAVWLSMYTKAALHIQIHGDVFNPRFFVGSPLGVYKTTFAQWVIRRAKKIRAVSQRIKNSLVARGVGDVKIAVVPIQSDMHAFLEVGRNREYKNTEPLTFLYVGRFSSEKNLPLLLRAFANAAVGYPAAHLQLLGDGPEKAALQALCASLEITEKVTFIPWSDDVASSMAAANVFCLSSLHEGFAMVLVEAMATGLPIITTDVGCVGDWLVHKEQGLVVPVDDVSAYAIAMSNLLADAGLRERLGKNAYARAEARKISSENYLHAIEESFIV